MIPAAAAAAPVPVPPMPMPPAAAAPAGDGEAAFAAHVAQAGANQSAEEERSGEPAEPTAAGAGQEEAGAPSAAAPQPLPLAIGVVGGAATAATETSETIAADGGVAGGPVGSAGLPREGEGGAGRAGAPVRPADSAGEAAEDAARATAVPRPDGLAATDGGEAAWPGTRGADADGATRTAGLPAARDATLMTAPAGVEPQDAADGPVETFAVARAPGGEFHARTPLAADPRAPAESARAGADPRTPPAEAKRAGGEVRPELSSAPSVQGLASAGDRPRSERARGEPSAPRHAPGAPAQLAAPAEIATQLAAATLRQARDAAGPPAPGGLQPEEAPRTAPAAWSPDMPGQAPAGGVGEPRQAAAGRAGTDRAASDVPALPDGGWTPEPGSTGRERVAPVWAEAGAQSVPEARGGVGWPAAGVARQVVQAVVEYRGAEAQVVLDPEELGPVRVAVSLEDGGTVIRILAERPETAELMRRHADLLLQDLAGSGVSQPRLSFAAGGESGGGREGGGRPAPPQDPAPSAASATAPSPPRSAPDRRAWGGLDIRV